MQVFFDPPGAMRRAMHAALTVLGTLLATLSPQARADAQIEALLRADTAPPGVVFEIVGARPESLDALIQRVEQYIGELRERYPELEVAIVSHGREQFALLEERQAVEPELHRRVRSLSEDQNVPVHVCGTHASWRDKVPEDFPAYVDVAPAGPAQINDYRALGFAVVVLP